MAGEGGVGRRALATALGATEMATSAASVPWSWPLPARKYKSRNNNSSRRCVDLEIVGSRHELAALAARDCGPDVSPFAIVVVFDLTNRDSFEAAVAQWSTLGRSGRVPVLLVGTHVDHGGRRREVFAAEAQVLVDGVAFDRYIEVCATRTPFDGVSSVAQWLGERFQLIQHDDWHLLGEKEDDRSTTLHHDPTKATTATAGTVAVAATTAPPPGSGLRPCVHTSVWLYDPTEIAPSEDGDVKIRPISRALFEMRAAGDDKAKAVARYRDRETLKRLSQCRYFGPTESSRHMRWQEAQRQQQRLQPKRKTRQSREADVSLLNKSFMQGTELQLIRQRLLACEKTGGSQPPHQKIASKTKHVRKRDRSVSHSATVLTSRAVNVAQDEYVQQRASLCGPSPGEWATHSPSYDNEKQRAYSADDADDFNVFDQVLAQESSSSCDNSPRQSESSEEEAQKHTELHVHDDAAFAWSPSTSHELSPRPPPGYQEADKERDGPDEAAQTIASLDGGELDQQDQDTDDDGFGDEFSLPLDDDPDIAPASSTRNRITPPKPSESFVIDPPSVSNSSSDSSPETSPVRPLDTQPHVQQLPSHESPAKRAQEAPTDTTDIDALLDYFDGVQLPI